MGKHKHKRREEYPQDLNNNGYMGSYNNTQMNMNPQNGAMGMQMGNGGMNQGQMNQGQMNQGQMNQGQMSMNNPNAQMGMNNMNQMNNMNNMNQMNNMNPMNMGNNQGQMNMMNNPLGALLGGGGLNGIMQLLSTLGLGDLGQGFGGGGLSSSGIPGLGQGSGGDILSMLTGQGGGGDILSSMLTGQGGGGDILSMLTGQGGGDLIGMLGNLFGGQQQKPTTADSSYAPRGKEKPSVEEILAQIKPEDIDELQRVLSQMQSNKEEKKKDDSVEDILANLDFNAILNNINSSNIDFSNVDVGNLDIDEIMKEDEFKEEIQEVEEAEIVEENILEKEKALTEEEYIKLINILLKLIDANKIRLLKKIVDEYNKAAEK